MITALSANNKVEFVDGSAPEPPKTDRMHGTCGVVATTCCFLDCSFRIYFHSTKYFMDG